MQEEAINICADCSAATGGCCRHTRIFVTLGDMRRIAAATGKEPACEYVPVPEEDVEYAKQFDPPWSRIFTASGRRVMQHEADGRCRYLGPAGCRLAMDVRPLICRLYPFEYDAVCIKGVSGHHCPEEFAANPPLLLALLGMNQEEGEMWRRLLYEEILEEFPDDGKPPAHP